MSLSCGGRFAGNQQEAFCPRVPFQRCQFCATVDWIPRFYFRLPQGKTSAELKLSKATSPRFLYDVDE